MCSVPPAPAFGMSTAVCCVNEGPQAHISCTEHQVFFDKSLYLSVVVVLAVFRNPEKFNPLSDVLLYLIYDLFGALIYVM